jgi:polar amino acid transport system substrate-binding protein
MGPNRSGISAGLQDRRPPFARSGIFILAALSAFIAPSTQSRAVEETPFRLCADPTNLPFSSDNPSRPGFYVEIGQALAQALGRPITYEWYKSYFGKRTVRVTLLGKQCDAMIGLPLSDDFMGPAVIFSRKIVTESYALVSASNKSIAGFDDLRGKRVAVQFQTTPQNLLAERDDIEKVTVLTPEEGMTALDQGKADVAFMWGPVAGWLNKSTYGNRYSIQSTEGRGLSWDVAIGFAKTSGQLRDQVDAALPMLERTIAELSTKYGLPTDQPIRVGSTQAQTKGASGEMSAHPRAAAQPLPDVAPSPSTANAELTTGQATPAAQSAELVSAGKEIFNGTCAHCHGPDAVQGERRIDLRLLQHRYGEDMRSKYWTTVHEGRPAKGMPPWSEVFTDDQFESIYAFLLSVQSPTDPSN